MSPSLPPDDLRRLEELFDVAADLPPEERAAFVERECGANDALRAELARLLEGLESEDVLHRIQSGGAPLAAGTRIGPYELIERIGEGGMGEVYAADQLEPVVRRVALKVIKRGMDTAQVVARFEAERQTLAMMSHPNIAQVHDGGATPDGRPYFVMELVDGAPITEHCDRRGLSTRERLALFLDVCDGVRHAHQKGVIHRDLKPSNLLVTEQDGRAVPKIIDFGVARATTGSLAERSLHTTVGQIVGTLDYMSPEQADPTQLDVDTRSDVYSLGVVLYQLVSGLLPLEHSSAADVPLSEVQRAIRELDPPTPSTRLRRQTATLTTIAPRHGTDERSLLRQLSGDLDRITLKALEKDPARRYQSAAELADDLRRHLADEPVLAGRPGALYRARKFVRRHRVGVTAGVVVAAALGAGVYGVVSGRLAAEARAAEALYMASGYRLRQIEAEADAAWPPHPEMIPRLEALRDWLQRLVRDVPLHRAALEQREWNLESIVDQWQHALLSELVETESISALLDAEPPLDSLGWSLRRRLDEARKLEASFTDGGDCAVAWSDALPRIRHAYPGLELRPQMGLLPLGPDPDSGLWEFAHLLSGAPAERDPETNKIVPSEEMGLVFVLLPGGKFLKGAQRDDPDGPNFDPYMEPSDARKEGPVFEVTIAPFFISKFEMTQAQWERLAGSSPGPAVGKAPSMRITPESPVSGVSWTESDRGTRRLGLTLPKEVQWLYAARGGTDTVWWLGNDPDELEGAANLYDQSLLEAWPDSARAAGDVPTTWSDGYPGKSPVGTFRANPFGLHDVHGNVSEWCSARGGRPIRISRGGSYLAGVYISRVTYRGRTSDAHFRHAAAGLRPTRAVDP